MEILHGGRGLPAGGRVEVESAAGLAARGGHLDSDRFGGARGDEKNFRVELQRDGRNHRKAPAGLRRRCARDELQWLVGDNESLAVDGEDVLDGNGRRILRTANERRVIDPGEAGRAIGAKPVRLREGGVDRQHTSQLTDGGGAGGKIGGFGRG